MDWFEKESGTVNSQLWNMGSSSNESVTNRRRPTMFTHRIVRVDFFMDSPCKDFDPLLSPIQSHEVKRVPLLRIFGATPLGQKTCAIIHGVFPYIYILDDPSIPHLDSQIPVSLNHEINLALGKTGTSAKNFPHVFKVLKVSGKTFYGYRETDEQFLKIFFYSPYVIKQAIKILLDGKVCGKSFQPYEAHIPFHLQFMMDYCLYGMNLVSYSKVRFRNVESASPNQGPSPMYVMNGSETVWDLELIPENLCGPLELPKISRCELEIDVLASDIIVNTTSGLKSSNPGIDAIWMDEMERRRQHDIANWSQISIPESQPRVYMGEKFPKEAELYNTLLKSLVSVNTEESTQMNVQSSDEISEVFSPCSQITDHTSLPLTFAQQVEISSSQLSWGPEEEEMVRLLESMQHDKDDDSVQEIEAGHNEDLDEPALEESEDEDKVQNEDEWSQSFLSCSVLDAIEQEYMDNEVNKNDNPAKEVDSISTINASDIPVSNNEIVVETNEESSPEKIPQVDGYWDDSDSDESPRSKKEKRRQRAVKSAYSPSKLQQKHGTSYKKHELHSPEPTSSKLSLTRRKRKSEKADSNSNETIDEEAVITCSSSSSCSNRSTRSSKSRSSLPQQKTKLSKIDTKANLINDDNDRKSSQEIKSTTKNKNQAKNNTDRGASKKVDSPVPENQIIFNKRKNLRGFKPPRRIAETVKRVPTFPSASTSFREKRRSTALVEKTPEPEQGTKKSGNNEIMSDSNNQVTKTESKNKNLTSKRFKSPALNTKNKTPVFHPIRKTRHSASLSSSTTDVEVQIPKIRSTRLGLTAKVKNLRNVNKPEEMSPNAKPNANDRKSLTTRKSKHIEGAEVSSEDVEVHPDPPIEKSSTPSKCIAPIEMNLEDDIADSVKKRTRGSRFRGTDSESSRSPCKSDVSTTTTTNAAKRIKLPRAVLNPESPFNTTATVLSLKKNLSGRKTDSFEGEKTKVVQLEVVDMTSMSTTESKKGRGKPRKKLPVEVESDIVDPVANSPVPVINSEDVEPVKKDEDLRPKSENNQKQSNLLVPMCSEVILCLQKCDSPTSELKPFVDEIEKRTMCSSNDDLESDLDTAETESESSDEENKVSPVPENKEVDTLENSSSISLADNNLMNNKDTVQTSPLTTASRTLEEDEQLDEEDEIHVHFPEKSLEHDSAVAVPMQHEEVMEMEVSCSPENPPYEEIIQVSPSRRENEVLEHDDIREVAGVSVEDNANNRSNHVLPTHDEGESEISTTTSAFFELEALMYRYPPRWESVDGMMEISGGDGDLSSTELEVSSSSNDDEQGDRSIEMVDISENVDDSTDQMDKANSNTDVNDSSEDEVMIIHEEISPVKSKSSARSVSPERNHHANQVNVQIQTKAMPTMCDMGVGTTVSFCTKKVDKAIQTDPIVEPVMVSCAVGCGPEDFSGESEKRRRTVISKAVETVTSRKAVPEKTQISSPKASPFSSGRKSVDTSHLVKSSSKSKSVKRDKDPLSGVLNTKDNKIVKHHKSKSLKKLRRRSKSKSLSGTPIKSKETYLMELAKINKAKSLGRKVTKALLTSHTRQHVDKRKHRSKLEKRFKSSKVNDIDNVFIFSPRTPDIKLPSDTPSLSPLTLCRHQKPSVTSVTPQNFLSPRSSRVHQPKKTVFQIKKSKKRLKSQLRVSLLANKGVPDIDKYEFEPLKPPPTFRDIKNWAEKVELEETIGNFRKFVKNKEKATIPKTPKVLRLDMDLSDEEIVPEVRPFGGGNLSDEDADKDDDAMNDSVNLSQSQSQSQSSNIFSPITPAQKPLSRCISTSSRLTSSSVHNSGGFNNNTPKSILKLYTSNRSRVGSSAKRRIRWEDEEIINSGDSNHTNHNHSPKVQVKNGDLRRLSLSNSNASVSTPLEKAFQQRINTSEIDGVSQKNMGDFAHNMSNLQDAKALHMNQYLTVFSVEVFCDVRGDLLPDPQYDAILGIFIHILNDVPEGFKKPRMFDVYMIVTPKGSNGVIKGLSNNESLPYKSYQNERQMFDAFLQLVYEWDPDILVGYEIQKSSWGYIIERGQAIGLDMISSLSRILPVPKKNDKDKIEKQWREEIDGRIVLNLWSILRHEITVQSYTYENSVYHILHRRVCCFTSKQLKEFWDTTCDKNKVMLYFQERVKGVIQIIEKLDLINRTSELARLFGILFYEVLSRGSQYRVESMMLRLAKPKNYIPISPSVMQRAYSKAPEFFPMVLEPYSKFQREPIAVLDFQSLYPSMIIAYNYDYATVLGRVSDLGTDESFQLGCLKNQIPKAVLAKLKDHIHISPAGVAFVDRSIKKGILPEMLEQILETRLMVKRAIKKWKGEGDALAKILDSRQLGLKLIANVSYGYTSANYSGRMPCVEIADSVVSKGKETLQRAIQFVKDNFSRWKAEVVYGDTDSLFVKFPDRTKEEAFVLAQQIADEVTQANPKPVKLKLEKIYQPCILQSKKRYVGFSYETPDQKEPKYDAKGIETVRRDGCPAVKKILEKTLHLLFTHDDETIVRNFVELQFKKLFNGHVSMKEYTFARQYRGRNGYKPGACVPSLEIAKRLLEKDPRAEPLVKQRVPYVIVYDSPNLPLIKMVRTPMEFVGNDTLRLHAHYYIEKVIIPALNRCLKLANMDASRWYGNLPRKYLRNIHAEKKRSMGTLDQYVLHQNCFRCDEKTDQGVCSGCRKDMAATIIYLSQVSQELEKKWLTSKEICRLCSTVEGKCVSLDCPVFHKLLKYERDQPMRLQMIDQIKKLEW